MEEIKGMVGQSFLTYITILWLVFGRFFYGAYPSIRNLCESITALLLSYLLVLVTKYIPIALFSLFISLVCFYSELLAVIDIIDKFNLLSLASATLTLLPIYLTRKTWKF